MAWLNGWSYRKSITIDHTKVDEDLTDFPVLVKLTSSNFDFSDAQSNGNDIRFTSNDGSTLLKYERERHDSSDSKAEYWVKIPSVSSTSDTVFYIYYGNDSASDGADPTNVWDSNFVGVWHLNQDPSNTAPQELDSTSNNNDGTSNGSMTSDDLVEGQVDGALDFDGSDDYIKINGTPVPANADFSFSAGVYPQASGGGIFGVSKDEESKWAIRLGQDIFYSLDVNSNVYSIDYSDLPLNDWSFIYLIRSGSTFAVYINGQEAGSTSMSGALMGNAWQIIGAIPGRAGGDLPYYTSIYFSGLIDEVHISNVARSASWIKASYNSENDSLVTFGGPEVVNLFDGKVDIKDVAINLLDGKTEVYIGGMPKYDGKVKILVSVSSLLDGKVDVNAPADLLDGKATIQSGTLILLDGKIDVKDAVVALLDGEARIRDALTDPLDGKVHLIHKAIDLLDGKVEVVYIVENVFDGKVAPTNRLGNLNAYSPLPSTVFKLGGHIVNNVPCVDSTLLGIFRYARMQASLSPFRFNAITGSRIVENAPGFIANIVGTNPKVGIINGYIEPLYGIFRIGTEIKSKIDSYGCAIYADTANISRVDGYIPGVISISQSDSEDIANVLGSVVSPRGSFDVTIGNVGGVYGRIPYLLQVIEAKPGIITNIIGEATLIGAKITASRSGNIVIISDIPGFKWHSLVDNGVKCVILKYERGY